MNLEETVNQDINPGLKESVLNWLDTMQIGPYQYRMSEGADSSIFTSCFALFILHLLNALDDLSAKGKKGWAEHIKIYQDRNTGLFIPEYSNGYDEEKLTRQLTCFCLSALNLLDERPNLPLSFMEEYKTPEGVENYLYRIGCHRGVGGTGNKAMFLAIFLTYLIEYQQDDSARNKLEAWFNWHNKNQNPETGFWGDTKNSFSYHGLQNGFHQLLIYFYWDESIQHMDKIVDLTLQIQDRKGFFAPTPGGGGCWDYDAIYILSNVYRISELRKMEIIESLKKAYYALTNYQNTDGGFCQSKWQPKNLMDIFNYFSFIIYGDNPNLWFERFKKMLIPVIKKRTIIHTGWTKKGRLWNESNLWDTWFRCLSLAEISRVLSLKELDNQHGFGFHEIIGLGYSKNFY